MEICSSYRCAVTQHKCIETYSEQDAITTVQCCSAKQARTRQFVTADSTMEICSSYRCPVTQHKRIATLFRARCNHHSSVLLCKTGSHKAVCHSRFTYGDLLFTQVCSDPAQMYCSYVQGKMQLPQFSAALQNRLTPGSVSQQIHLWRSALHAGVQRYSTNALQLCSGQNAVSTVQCCSATPAHTRQFGTADSPLEVFFVQRRSTNELQLCSGQDAITTVQQNRLTPGIVSQQIHLWRFALHTSVQ